MLRWVARVKPPETLCLVSDSIRACGLPPGRYRFAGNSVRLHNGKVTLADGTLAGSALSLDQAFRIQVQDVGIPVEKVAISASQAPARVLNWQRHRGEIDVNKRADLVVMSRRLKVKQTYLGGERVF